MLRTLAESSSEFRRLSEHVVRTGAAPSRDRFGSSERTVQKALQVFRIERILMSDAETKYREQRMNMFLDRGASRCELQDCCALRPDSFHDLDIGLDELLLYHGCRAGSIHGILHEGFDPSRSGERAGQFFGCGTYFADVAAKADSYVDVAPDGVRCIIVAQVCLGKALRALRAMPRFHPSCREAEDEGPACDSVIGEDTKHGGILDHREYVIYRGAQAIPRYLVWYQHCEGCSCFRCRSALHSARPMALPPLRLPAAASNAAGAVAGSTSPAPPAPRSISARSARNRATTATQATLADEAAASSFSSLQRRGLRATSWERPRNKSNKDALSHGATGSTAASTARSPNPRVESERFSAAPSLCPGKVHSRPPNAEAELLALAALRQRGEASQA